MAQFQQQSLKYIGEKLIVRYLFEKYIKSKLFGRGMRDYIRFNLLLVLSISILILPANSIVVPVPECSWQGTSTANLMAGQNTDSGDVIVFVQDGNIIVNYQTQGEWKLYETQLYVGTNAPTNSAPGQFPYKHQSLGGISSDTFVIPLTDLNGLGGGCDSNAQKTINIAAHAVVKKPGQEETGWGAGTRFDKGWAMYFTVELRCICGGRIQVDKITDPSGDSQAFTFTPSGYGSSFTLTDTQAVHDSGLLLPGTYTVAETIQSGWTLKNIVPVITGTGGSTVKYSSSGSSWHDSYQSGDRYVQITLKSGDTVKLTYTNEKQKGRIQVDKITDPSGDSQAFTFTPSGYGSSFTLTDTQAVHDSGLLLPGTYTVAETIQSGWTLKNIVPVITGTGGSTVKYSSSGSSWHDSYQSGDRYVQITLKSGDTVKLTYTNEKQKGRIQVDKITDPSGDSQAFTFTPSGYGSSFTLTDTQAVHDSGLLLPGTYTVAETIQSGWTLKNIVPVITGTGGSTVKYSSSGSSWHDSYQSGDRYVQITLKSGDTVKLTYTNGKKSLKCDPECYSITYEMSKSGYDPTSDKTRFTYTVCESCDPAISHWLLVLPGCVKTEDVVATNWQNYEFGKDPTTGLTGIKFDDLDISGDKSGCQEFWFELMGQWGSGSAQAGLKAGQQICTAFSTSGPICPTIPKLMVTKAGPKSVCSGDDIVFTITVKNEDKSLTANNVQVTDAVPGHTVFKSADSSGSYDAGTKIVTWNIATITPGQEAVLKLTVTADGTYSGSVTNTAKLIFPPGTSTSSNEVTVTVNGKPQIDALSDQEICLADEVELEGKGLGYKTILWTTSGDGSFENANNLKAKYTPGSSDKSEGKVTLTLTLTSESGCSVSDEMEVKFKDCQPQLTIAKEGPKSVCSGDDIVFTITVKNEDKSLTANNVQVTDAVPGHTVFKSADSSGSYDAGTKIVTWNIATITPGQEAVLKLTVTADGTYSGSVTNTAKLIFPPGTSTSSNEVTVTVNGKPQIDALSDQEICLADEVELEGKGLGYKTILWTTSGDGSFENANNLKAKYTPGSSDKSEGKVTLTLTLTSESGCSVSDEMEVKFKDCQPQLTIAKEGPKSVCSGDDIVFTITVKNEDKSLTANNVQVTDAVPGHTVFKSADSSGSYDAGTKIVTWNIATITPGQEAVLKLTVTADGTYSGSVTNTAKLIFPPGTSTSSNEVTVTVNGKPQIDALSDQEICLADEVELEGKGLGYKTILWTTSGDGSFENANNLKAKYTPGSSDKSEGKVTLTLTLTSESGCSVSDEMEVKFKDCQPQLTIAKEGPKSVCSGDDIVFTITVKNEDKSLTANNVKVTDAVPGHTVFKSADSIISGSYDAGTKIVTWNIATITPGQEAVLKLTVTADGTYSGSVTNTAKLIFPPGTSTSSNEVTVTVNGKPQIDALSDQEICLADEVELEGKGLGYKTILWTTSGDGSFENANNLKAKYTPGSSDKS